MISLIINIAFILVLLYLIGAWIVEAYRTFINEWHEAIEAAVEEAMTDIEAGRVHRHRA